MTNFLKKKKKKQVPLFTLISDTRVSFCSAPLNRCLFFEGILRNNYFTHYRPAMPFGNRKIYFSGSFQFSIVTI